MTGLPTTRAALSLSAVLALLAIAPAIALAQPGVPEAPPGLDPVVLPTSRTSDSLIKTAHDYIAAKDWDNATKLLQRVLDDPQDSLLEIEVKNPPAKPIVRRVSARAEAERLLAGLPKQGLAVYRVKFGGLAQVALGKARSNPLLIDDVVRRYFLTDAGADALTQMGIADLDRGRVEDAADHFRRLLQRPDADDLPPLTLFQAALAFHAASDSTRENQVMQVLGRRIGPGGLSIGGPPLTLDDLRKEVVRWPAAAPMLAEWPLFRGDARRAGRADGDLPLLEARNRIAIPANEEAKNRLTDALNCLAPPTNVGPVGPGLPGFTPLAVGGKIVYRAFDGLHAVDAESGREVWQHASPLSLDSLLQDDNKRAQLLKLWLPKYAGFPTLLDENATLGTLSSDGRRVYFVEDVPVPAHPNDVLQLQQAQASQPVPGSGQPPVPRPWFSSLEGNLYHNRLRAVDLLTGDLRWEIGAWDKAHQHDPVKDFQGFLGAPLPVGRRLFAQAEFGGDMMLLCLDPETGATLWSQKLAGTSEYLPQDPGRRMQPAQLAYADGVLICPTNVGAVVAVDPMSHNILWAHTYSNRVNNPIVNGAPGFYPEQYVDSWKGCAPIIHGDKVLVTSPDIDSVQCLNLRDGTLLWSTTRTTEDLYIAGVFGDKAAGEKVLIVGKTTARAVSLDKGTEVWTQAVETGAPSGLGATTGKYYLIPLQSGGLCVLDMTKNPATATQIEDQSNKQGQAATPLGNLIFHGGDLWSQSATAVSAFPQIGKGLNDANDRVAKAPKDPVARIDRGRLFYTKGQLNLAVDDWLIALDNNPPDDLTAPTRERLFNVLTQMLQQDFKGYEQYLAPYEKLCRQPAPAGDTPEQARAWRAEQHRRELNLLAIVAHGREAQGRLDLALQAYRDLLDAAAANELMTAPEDPSVHIRPELWVQGHVAELARTATPEQAKTLRERVDQDWRAAQSAGDTSVLLRFFTLYGTVPGPLGAPGREARLMLAERWQEERDRRHALDAELQLHYLRHSELWHGLETMPQPPEVAARAQYAWARLLTRHGMLADAVDAYRGLARDFPAVVVHDGKTGAALLDDLAADKRFVAYLDDPLAARPSGRAKFVELAEQHAPQNQLLPCEPQDGVAAPAGRNLRLGLDPQTLALQVAAADGSSEPWSIPLPVPVAYLHQYVVDTGGYTYTYQASDHFLVVSLGPVIVGIDRIERRARWVRSLLPADLPPNVQFTPGGLDGSIWLQTTDGRGGAQRLGVLGPIGPNGVIVQIKSGVAALDLSSGDVRWQRTDPAAMLDAFGDEQRLFLVESHAAGDVRAIRGVRTTDGVATPIPDCVDVYNHHLRTFGPYLLATDQGANDEVVLRLYDVQTGKDLWKKTFPAQSIILDSAVPELTAVAAPDGTVTVVDLAAQKELATLKLADKKHVESLIRGMLLRDKTQYYVALQTPLSPAQAAIIVGDPTVNFSGVVKTTEVNGMIYAFDRATGEMHWFQPAESQVLLLDHFEESPVLLLSATQTRQLPGNPGGQQIAVSVTRSIDKKTGRLLYKKEVPNNPDPYFELQFDARTGAIDLINTTTRLRHYLEAGKDSGLSPGAHAPGY